MPRSVDKLQSLHDEFDLANTAASKFHVAFELVRADDVALDAPLDTGNFIQQIGRCARGINERLMLPQEFVSQLTAAADSTRLDQRKTFPGFAEPGIIVFHALERAGQWPGRAFGSQTQIDTEKRASRMPGRKRFEDSFSQPVKEFVIGNVRGELAFLTVEKKKINVRAMISSPPPSLPSARMANSALGEPYCCRNSVFQCSNTLRIQISATCESSPVVSSSDATFASSRTAMRVISRPFQKRRAEK